MMATYPLTQNESLTATVLTYLHYTDLNTLGQEQSIVQIGYLIEK